MSARDLPLWLVRVYAFVWGAIWGSFANVFIYRWPREMSVLRPASHCPHCDHPVRAYDNVPILAWLWLRGRCRDCKAPISPRYPMVEALYAIAAFVIAERLFRGDPDQALSTALALFFVRFALAWGLLSVAFVDMETMLIPDVISLPGVALGVGASAMLPGLGWRASVTGAAMGAAIPLSLYLFWRYVLRREGMGLGDVKLLAMIGAFQGQEGVLFAMFAGSLQGMLAVGVSKLTGWKLGPDHPFDDDDEESDAAVEADAKGDDRVKRDDATSSEAKSDATSSDAKSDAMSDEKPSLLRTMLPFGPFLALGAIEYLLGADVWVREYVAFLRGER